MIIIKYKYNLVRIFFKEYTLLFWFEKYSFLFHVIFQKLFKYADMMLKKHLKILETPFYEFNATFIIKSINFTRPQFFKQQCIFK